MAERRTYAQIDICEQLSQTVQLFPISGFVQCLLNREIRVCGLCTQSLRCCRGAHQDSAEERPKSRIGRPVHPQTGKLYGNKKMSKKKHIYPNGTKVEIRWEGATVGKGKIIEHLLEPDDTHPHRQNLYYTVEVERTP